MDHQDEPKVAIDAHRHVDGRKRLHRPDRFQLGPWRVLLLGVATDVRTTSGVVGEQPRAIVSQTVRPGQIL